MLLSYYTMWLPSSQEKSVRGLGEAWSRVALDGAGGVTDDLRGKIPAFGTKPGAFE